MTKAKVVYAIDIGDVSMRGGYYIDGVTQEVAEIPTPRTTRHSSGEDNLWAAVADMVAWIELEAPPMEALAVSTSGIMTLQPKPDAREWGPFKDLELFVLAPNVDGLKYVPVLSRIEALDLRVPVHVENDVNAALSSVTEYDDAICINLGGGLGAAAKRNGQIQHVRGTWSCYEIGHGMRWDLPEHLTRLCHCGSTGCLEAAIGGWAMAERYGYRPETASPELYMQMAEDVLELLPHAIVSVIRQTGISRVLLSGRGLLGYCEADSEFVKRLQKAVEVVDPSLGSIEMGLIRLGESAELQGSAVALLSYMAK